MVYWSLGVARLMPLRKLVGTVESVDHISDLGLHIIIDSLGNIFRTRLLLLEF